MEIKELMEDSLDKHISKLQENVIKMLVLENFLLVVVNTNYKVY